MSSDRMSRLLEARKYQKKAIRALLPESMQEHADVIEKEIAAMIREGIFEVMQSEAGMEVKKSSAQKSKVKKVDIS